jgi:hypothetical protein
MKFKWQVTWFTPENIYREVDSKHYINRLQKEKRKLTYHCQFEPPKIETQVQLFDTEKEADSFILDLKKDSDNNKIRKKIIKVTQ